MYPLWEPLLTYQFQLFTSFFFVELILKMGPSQKLRSLCFFRKPESWNFPKICVLIAVVRKIRQRHKKHHGAQQGAGEANLHLLWRKKRGGCLFSRYCVFCVFFVTFFWGKGNGKLATMLSNTQKPPGDFVFETVLKEQIPINNDHKNTPNNPWTSIVLKMFPMQKGDLLLAMIVCSAGILKATRGWLGDQ